MTSSNAFSEMLMLAAWLAVPAVASLVLVRLLIPILKARSILDHPGARSSHDVPTPRGGGLVVTGVILVGWGVHHSLYPMAGTIFLIAGTVLVTAISWWDDLSSRSAAFRILVHLGAVGLGCVWLSGQGLVFQGILPAVPDLILAALIWVGFLNFFNFMDGIDGISAVEAVAISVGLLVVGSEFSTALFAREESFLFLLIAGAVIGFAVWNWPPARIFLGDVGSVPLGFLLGGLLLGLAARGAWVAALILPLYYLADAGITLMLRLLRGEKIWQAHRSHFYQQAVARGLSHGAVSSAILVANLLLMITAWQLSHLPVFGIACGLAVVAALLIWMKKWPASS